jgi:formylglycine-generating enzyme required for sulfatase activity
LVAAALAAPRSFAITIPTVPIGNPGNPPDMRYVDAYHPSGVGSVGYSFRMGQTEVTNAEYVAFLNAVAATDTYGLYPIGEPYVERGIVRSGPPGSYSYSVAPPALSGTYAFDYKPVRYIGWGDAVRFANWLHNGQPTGPQDSSTTEDGAYTLNGAVTNAALSAVTRNEGARWWLPNEDEWYKAAYHKNDGITGNYWIYATATDSVPDNHLPQSDTGNSVNFRGINLTTGDDRLPLTDAGAYALSGSSYGTFDQNGNVREWNERFFFIPNTAPRAGIRGGSWRHSSNLEAFTYQFLLSTEADANLGFRVASIPEPSLAVLLGSATCLLPFLRRRKLISSNRRTTDQ